MIKDLSAGTLLKNRYSIEKELGRGGMGIVYLGRDLQLLSRPVVIKVLFEEASRDDVLNTKFKQEMEALTRVDHPGIVGILDAGEMEDGRPFLVMQFIEGDSLRSLLSSEVLSLNVIADILSQTANALSAAHEKGIFHRDLKPENIMIQRKKDGNIQIKLIDFGLAKVMNSKIAESTKIPNVTGSYGYMSPEQLTGKAATAAGDVYSLGVIAFEMISGQRPYNPDSAFELLELQRKGPENPKERRHDLPAAAGDIVIKALSFEQQNRPDIKQFARVFSEALSGHESASVRVIPPISRQTKKWAIWTVGFLSIVLMIVLAKPVFNPSINFHSPGRDPRKDGFTLNYSDPKGYRYTFDSTVWTVSIDPGMWNSISDYSIQITLSPQIEFADVYFDPAFGLKEQLTLVYSNTNDILVLRKVNDNFQRARQIRFTCKYRSYNQRNQVTVHLKTENQEFVAESDIVLNPDHAS